MMSNAQTISLVVADDHPLLLEGIVRVLEAEPDFDVRATCCDGSAALDAIRCYKPAIALLDVAMPTMTGLQVLAALKAEASPTKVVFLTANASDADIFAMIEDGAVGLLLKDAPIDQLVCCIRRVGEGRRILPSELITKALERETGRRARLEHFMRVLTAREHEIVRLVAEGLENKQVARRLKLSEGTVRLHMHHIYQKTEIGNRAALIAVALGHSEIGPR